MNFAFFLLGFSLGSFVSGFIVSMIWLFSSQKKFKKGDN